MASARYRTNVLSVTRQMSFMVRGTKAVDVVQALNGLPVATAEIKNSWTRQTYHHAERQYRQDRAPDLGALLGFKRRAACSAGCC